MVKLLKAIRKIRNFVLRVYQVLEKAEGTVRFLQEELRGVHFLLSREQDYTCTLIKTLEQYGRPVPPREEEL